MYIFVRLALLIYTYSFNKHYQVIIALLELFNSIRSLAQMPPPTD